MEDDAVMMASNQSPLPLKVERLFFRYRRRRTWTLRDILLEARPGELILVAGMSGCGKSTLARSINGLIPHSYRGERRGAVYVLGDEVAQTPKAQIAQRVGTLLQDPERQIVGAYVENEIAFGLENLGFPREDILRRIDHILTYLNMPHLRHRETFALSGGEKQKVALAGILVMEPQMLILDEPLANLDPATAQEALAWFRRLADEGRTVIIIEHRVEDVLRIHPDRVFYMENGRGVFFGPPEDLPKAVDYRQVKLPAPWILRLSRKDRMPEFEPQVGPPGSRREPLVVYENVSFRYDEEGPWVLKDINWTIYRGDIIALLGPNGAGKSTLMKHALGLLRPTRGRVLVYGRDTREASVAQLAARVGYVFQNPRYMLFARTVAEEVAFGPTNLGYPPDEVQRRVQEALEMLDLTAYAQDPPLSLSFGQQRRVGIASVVAMGSKVLLLDEPTAGQDYWHYMTFMDGLLRLPYFEAVVFITHDVDLAVAYANRVVVMKDGVIQADGAPHEVLHDDARLREWRLVPTTLLNLNRAVFHTVGRFHRAEVLAHVLPQHLWKKWAYTPVLKQLQLDTGVTAAQVER